MNSRSKKTLSLVLLPLLTSLGCSKTTDVDKINDAQACLDSTTADAAFSCVDKVSGVSSEAADLIRCSAHFIFQEFTSPARLANIADSLKNSSNASSSSVVAMGLMAFTKASGSTTADQLSEAALSSCSGSKSKGMILMAGMSRIATSIVAAGGGAVVTACDPDQPGYSASTCETAMSSAVCSAPASTVGTAALTAYQQSCVGGTQSNSSVCKQFQTASAGSSDPSVVGGNVQDQVKGGGGCP